MLHSQFRKQLQTLRAFAKCWGSAAPASAETFREAVSETTQGQRPNTCREWEAGKRRACALERAGAARLFPDRPALAPTPYLPSRLLMRRKDAIGHTCCPSDQAQFFLATIGSPGKGQSVGGGLLLKELAPPRKPRLADARDRDCSLPAPATTLPARALSASPALPPWPPLCGVGKSWSFHSAPAASAPARGRIPRNRVSQPRREGFPPPLQGQESFPHLERQKLRVSPPFRIRSQRVPFCKGGSLAHLLQVTDS